MTKSLLIAISVALVIQADTTPDWDTTDWVAECKPVADGEAACSPDSPFASDMLAQLKASSQWFETIGFKQPSLDRTIDVTEFARPWKVYLGGVYPCKKRGTNEPNLAACYSPYHTSLWGIDTGGGAKITVGTDVRDDAMYNASAPTHELFHAIQGSYGITMGPWTWFVEGTAGTVEVVHYQMHGPRDASKRFSEFDRHGNLLLSGRGYYDFPLDDLKNPIAPHYKEYTSYLFWLFVGDALVPGDPVSGLRKLFDVLQPDREPIGSIDAAFKSFQRGGLDTYYSDFIAKRADEPTDFETHVRALKVLDGTEEEKKDEIEASVKRISARFHLVTAEPKSGQEAQLEIRVEGDDTDALHLIVDTERYDGGTGSKGTEKNVFRTTLTESKTFKVRVANVAKDASRTGDQNYKLSAKLITEEPECCSCDFTSTKTFFPQDDFQCSFSYPANWEAKYDPWDNMVYVSAPRCEKRCKGKRSMSFAISTGKDNNADTNDQDAMTQGIMKHVGSVSCGGRSGPVFRPPGTSAVGNSGAISFHVGNNDGKAYDARALFSCPTPGEWQELEKLFIGSVK